MARRSWAFVVYGEVFLTIRSPGFWTLEQVEAGPATLQSHFLQTPTIAPIQLGPGAYGLSLAVSGAGVPVLDYLLTPVGKGSVLVLSRANDDPWPTPLPPAVAQLALPEAEWPLVWRQTANSATPTTDERKKFLYP